MLHFKTLLLEVSINILRLMIVLKPPDFFRRVKLLDMKWDLVGITKIIAPLESRTSISASMQDI